ncbi:NAD(P)/FAD-dependent oxidoreductase [Salinarimonas soli]|uniref:NAD(P)/FAD-dependent oxidoreductase n=1 Tax=Salinarimonas soli TaxID=1638099 RepID=UPI001661F36C|nr:NAD(P)/FAD-dependent oxidoreductase [Salinarimonas soli]
MTPEIAVIGGGPAGSIAACALARAGRRVVLLEREREPRHKICGEFVSIEAQGALAQVGIDPAALGGAPIDMVRLVHGESAAESPLPFRAYGFTRRRLDEALLDAARAHGAEVIRGASVRRLHAADDGFRIEAEGSEDLSAGTVFLATGKHDLRGFKRDTAGTRDSLVGFKTYFRLPPGERRALAGAIEVILFAGGYAGLQLVEEGIANLCLLVEADRFEALGRSWDALFAHLLATCPHLDRRLGDAEPVLDKPLAIARVPYGFLHRPAGDEPHGLFRLGDQAAVIPSFSGDGMAIAMHSGRLAARTYLEQGRAASLFHARLRRDVGPQVRLAGALYAASRSGLGRRALVAACRLWPGGLRVAAERTRVPVHARLA